MKFLASLYFMLLMTGCWDIQIDLPNGYKYISESGNSKHEYIIYEKAKSLEEENENTIPATILNYTSNDKYILAKIQFHYDDLLIVGFNESKVLKEGNIYYYIIDVQRHIRYGAFDNKEKFNQKVNELSIPLNL